MYYLVFLIPIILNLSCASFSGNGKLDKKGRHNPFVSFVKPMLPKRVGEVYAHTLYDTKRAGGDCQPHCPEVDVWQYEYLGRRSSQPIATQKAFWKSPNEARIIAFSLFGKNPVYYQGLLEFLKSFKSLKELNQIKDSVWGLETFTPRVYVPKRNPFRVLKNIPLEGELEEYQLRALLEAGVEVAYVDNHLKKASKDATFWRFMIAAEAMPEGQKIRYLLRDADWVMTGPEAYSIGEWIEKGHRFHRAHLVPICIGPLTASWWGGTHTGKGDFENIKSAMEYFPYRYQYGDDELFLRDVVWPKIKASGSVLTHYTRRTWVSSLMNPYAGSCEEPTRPYCNTINSNNQCEDLELPSDLVYPSTQLGLRYGLEALLKKPEYFDMKLTTPRGQKIKKAFSI